MQDSDYVSNFAAGQQKTAASTNGSTVDIEETFMFEADRLESFPEWQLACSIAASKTFSRSELLPKFLLYVCEQYLLGNTRNITEQRIGTEVFQRPPNYNPGEDNIVRNYARLLRKRLAEYFDSEGANHSLWLEIPRGGYVPRFQSGPSPTEPLSIPASDESLSLLTITAPDPAVKHVESATPSSRHSISRFVWIISLTLVALFCLLLGALFGPAIWPHSFKKERTNSPAHILWTQLFQPNRNLLIVPPDSGLGILENLTGHTVSLDDYASGKYLSSEIAIPGFTPGSDNDLRRQRYTSMVGLKIATSLLQLPEFIPNRSEIRDARDMSPEDFKNSNVILLGSIHANPWVGLFEKDLNFRLAYTNKVDQSYIVNENPVGPEQKIYNNGVDGKANRTYGVIDYLPNLNNNGHVLIVQGLNMAATQAAAEILSNGDAIRSVLDRAKQPDGSLKMFELLIETNSIVTTARSAHIIAMRFYPDK